MLSNPKRSPFPGMDPYLEHPSVWPGVHGTFAVGLNGILGRTLPDGFFSLIETRGQFYLEIDGGDQPASGWTEARGPDLSVLPKQRDGRERESATLVQSSFVEVDETVDFASIAIMSGTIGGKRELVCAIELLSPTNKKPGGSDRLSYERKRERLLSSTAGLVEIDLLRTGVSFNPLRPQPSKPYSVCSSPPVDGIRRPTRVYSFGINEPLPTVNVPLGVNADPFLVDLQPVMSFVYENSGLEGIIDYDAPCEPPLSETLRPIVDNLIAEWRAAKP